MCRLYGFRANEPTKVECSLVYAQNALLSQSREDLGGVTHPDGWGIGYYEDGLQHVERRVAPAFEDLHFEHTAERVFSRTVVAHVRRATVGEVRLENVHPFTKGPWTFAHNGTVGGFQHVGPWMSADASDELTAARAGTTDSELAFLWLLSRLRRAGVDVETGETEARAVARVLQEAVRELGAACARYAPDQQARLNFLLTNGYLMVASRWNHSLHWAERVGLHDCEICGIPHVRHDESTVYRAAVVASEPITHERWTELPEGAVLAVDGRLGAEVLEG